ncbi:MAG: hypothetical protein S4CHLAM102_05120 [Chlamydiia bacterium]|nr:hypothetical protein [Chlamydiia bacterium]
MSKTTVTSTDAKELEKFLKKHRGTELITAYLYYLEKKHKIQPALFLREKKIYKSVDEIVQTLEAQNKLWRETEIKILIGKQAVNEHTTRVYICPFSGKVFGNNTHPNPQDAIYDWVSKCPENTEREDGMRVKRYFVSEDPNVIKEYIKDRTKAITKTVYTSAVTGKLYKDKQTIIDDFKKNHIKLMEMTGVLSQNRFEIQEDFLAYIEEQLEEEHVSKFLEDLSKYEYFAPFIERWMEEEEEEEEEEEVGTDEVAFDASEETELISTPDEPEEE